MTSLLNQPLSVAGVILPNRVFLAPMSGVSDLPFRQRAAAAGAGVVVSEMVASAELCNHHCESRKRMERGALQTHVVQLAGREAHWMGEAAKIAEGEGADIIDINMGCPAKKVTGGYSGSALMRDLDHALTLIEATVNAVKVPVTLKMRLGWDENSINAPELARRAVDAGVQMITVHGRTRNQFYEGHADWDAIAAVRAAIKVPLVANGDVGSTADAQEIMRRSGADAVMIGRASYGRPWLAGQIVEELRGGTGRTAPADLGDYVLGHYQAMLEHYGEKTGVRHARKHLGWYMERHAPHVPAAIKKALMTSVNAQEVSNILADIFTGLSPVCGARKLKDAA
ncbi:tRNA dihydrouridine synthase DusB [Pseudochrobactrum sp. HB0163]|uniref:tRNA dihydrouridine synthase DusB n=1 Tax=Pseudochrobactrum sp. HB0163 TaxID=3450708 RepID=UPI003F6E34C6